MTIVNPVATTWAQNTTVPNPTPSALTMPSGAFGPIGNWKAGDLMLLYVDGWNNPTVAITGPTGFTQLGSQHNGASGIGGRSAIFYRRFVVGDTTPSITLNGTSPFNYGAVFCVIRPYRAAATLTITGGIGVCEVEWASGTGTKVLPQLPVTTDRDLRIVFQTSQGSTNLPVAAASTKGVPNPEGLQFENAFATSTFVSTSQYGGVYCQHVQDSDTASTNWTPGAAGTKGHMVGVAISDNETSGIGVLRDPDHCPIQILAVSLDHIVTPVVVPAAPAYGGGVSVF